MQVRTWLRNYLGDCFTFVAPVTAVNPMASLNSVLAGASAVSITDVKKATGQACQVAMSVCKPIASTSPYTPMPSDTQKYVELAKAFSTLSEQGGVTP